ncbi:MAG: ribonuclease HII [Burkholderiales bacterium]|nr:MAG: ribonuclease HII [Burkholderiales bacterium]
MPRPRKTSLQPELLALPLLPKARKKRSDAKPVRKKQAPVVQTEFTWEAPGLTAGVDEAGRGPLAGNVVAAAVILDDLNPIKGLNDSKKLTALRREKLFIEIQAKALCVSIGQASVEEIDQLNILQATMLAMQRAVNGLRLKPAKVLIDGNRIPKLDVLAEAIVGGDALVKAISAASIIAKVTRDRQCYALHAQYPQYGFPSHKGYGTAEHMAALKKHGATPEHRKSYAPVAEAMARKAL